MSNTELNIHYSTGGIPPEIAENLKELFPEDGDLSCEEVLQQQETVYLSLQACWKNKDALCEHGQTSNGSQLSALEDESSHGESMAQLALDEALARSLELGDDFENFCIHQHHDTVAGNGESTHRETPRTDESLNPREDDIDPDNMSYEELRSLGEAVGHENRGLSDDVISRLPTFKYKIGFFSKKKKKDECVICYVEYTNGDWLATLPCAHMYHSKCITRWLKESKNCPLCYEEVRAD